MQSGSVSKDSGENLLTEVCVYLENGALQIADFSVF